MIKFSKNEILNLNNQYSENNSIICSTLRENCWDIFDSVSTMLTESAVLPGNLEELFTCVHNISNHIRDSELSLMAIEKILSFKFLRNIFPVTEDASTSTRESFDWIEEAIVVALEFLRGVMENELNWKAFALGKGNFFRPIIVSRVFETSQAHGLIIGVLTNMQSIIVSHLKSFEHRRRLTDMITYLLLQAAPNLFDVFNHVERSRHAAYLEAMKRITSGSNYIKSPTTTTTTTTTTPGLLFSDLPEKTRTTLLHYSLRHLMRCNQEKKCRNDWKKLVAVSCIHVHGGSKDVAVRVGSVYSEGCRASAVGIVALSDDIIAAKFAPLYKSCDASAHSNSKSEPLGCRYVSCGDCLRMFECVPWSLTGLGVIALHLVRSVLLCEEEQGLHHSHLMSPRVLAPSFLRWLCRAYLPHLLRDTSLAAAEGMRGIQLLGVISNTVQQKDVFLSPVCDIDGDELLSTSTSSILIPTDSAQTIFEPFADQLVQLPQAQDHAHVCDPGSNHNSVTITISQNILIHLAAESRERLFLCQGIISAMVACSDTTLRSAAYSAFKQYLMKGFEESSLFELLLKLCDCCPFQQVSGLLIDLAKECAQEASRAPGGKHDDHCHGDHWFDSISSEPRTAFNKVFRSKHISVSISSPHAAAAITALPHTWDEWQCSYETIHSTATVNVSYAVYESSVQSHQHSVFWSPLLVSTFFLRPLEEIIKLEKKVEDSSKKTDFMASKTDKLDDLMDVVAARVNLMLFVSLRLQAGLREYTTPLRNPFRRYASACNGGLLLLEEAVGDLFEAVRVTLALQSLLRSKLEEMVGVEDQLQPGATPSSNVINNSLKKKKKRRSDDLANHDRALQVQVLDANVEYLLNNLKSLCSALLTSLANNS